MTPPTVTTVNASTSPEVTVVFAKDTGTSPMKFTPPSFELSSMGPPAKKKRRYEYAPELKAKTREELLVYFESFTGRLGVASSVVLVNAIQQPR